MRLGELRALLEVHGLRPNPRFGQNFLVDPALLASIPADAGVEAGDRVLEVGPGAGSLTAELLAAGALEADVLAPRERFAPEVEDWWAEGAPPRLVANLPYAISGPFLGRLPGRAMRGATLLLQREVARKACGLDDGWSPLGVRLALAFHARVGRRLPPEVFWPRPQVDSAFLHLEPRPGAPDKEEDAALHRALRAAYAQRRKGLLSRLRKTEPAWAEALAALGVGEHARAEQVEPETWRQALHALS